MSARPSTRSAPRDRGQGPGRRSTRSAELSGARKSPPFRPVMSRLSFYINRAGRALPASLLSLLKRAKNMLRKLYGREATRASRRRTQHAGKGSRRTSS
jgi:hypothetical protein